MFEVQPSKLVLTLSLTMYKVQPWKVPTIEFVSSWNDIVDYNDDTIMILKVAPTLQGIQKYVELCANCRGNKILIFANLKQLA